MSEGRIVAEVEVKLEAASAQDLRRIGALRTLDPYVLRPRPVARLHTVYVDTPERALTRAGVAVRLRRGPDGWEVSAKWSGRSSGSLHERPELTLPLPARPRLPFVLPAGPLHTQLAAIVLGRPLSPILISDVRRRLLDLVSARETGADADALAEVALDTVQLRAPDGRPLGARYWEVEIEQRAGGPHDLTALADALQQRVALQPSRASKFARGMDALYGSIALPPVLAPVHAAETLAAAARSVMAAQLARLRACDPGTRLGEDAEALHDMRVAVRRLRAATRMFAAALPTRTYDLLTRELHWLGHELGAVRDLDVQIANLDWHRARIEEPARRRLDSLRRHMRRERATRRAALIAALDSPRYFRLLAGLERFALGRPARRLSGPTVEPVAEVGRRAIHKAMRRLIARGDAIDDLPDAADLHALRIRAKRLRYLLEALKPFTGSAGRKLIRRLARLQDVLGRFNDAMVASRVIRAYAKDAGASVGAETHQVLAALADVELRRAGAAQADFQRAWRRFTRRRVRRLSREVLARLASDARHPADAPSVAASATDVRKKADA